MHVLALVTGLVGIANAACPYMTGEAGDNPHIQRRGDDDAAADTEEFFSQFYLKDQDVYLTSDVGGPIEDQNSLSAGERGPTLLEDFIFRQKIQRFDHERVCLFVFFRQNSKAHVFIQGTGTRCSR
jgi:catalase